MNIQKIKSALLILFLLITTIPAQTGGSFTITKSVVAGGTQQSSGGDFSVDTTVGQTVAANASSGGDFSMTAGFWTPVVYDVGVEGDVAGRPSGDDSILSNDVILVRRFFNGTATPDLETNEFQRADTAPRATFGDGAIASNDIIQTRRYQNGTDAQQNADGPETEGGNFMPSAKTDSPNSGIALRELRVQSTVATAGQPVTVNIRVDARGDEAGYGFRLNYNNTRLLNPVIGAGNTGAAVRSCFAIATGLNCAVDTFPNNLPGSTDPNIGEIAAGNNQLLITITFNVAANAPALPLSLALTNVNASNDNADLVTITGTNGILTVSSPTAATVSIGGKVESADGHGIRNVILTLTNTATGEIRSMRSTTFGYYRFEEIEVGASYVLTVSAKKFSFNPNTRLLTVLDELTEVDFIALPET